MKQLNAAYSASRPIAEICLATALAISGTALIAVFFIQWAGYEPCELCLRQRIPYYLALPVMGLSLGAARLGMIGGRGLRLASYVALAAFLISFLLSGHHVGVEQGMWDGPAKCVSRTFDMSSLAAFAAQIGNTPMVSCSVPTFTLMGFSLAVWNLLLSASLSTLLWIGLRPSILRKCEDS